MANETESGKHENALAGEAVAVTVNGTTQTLQEFLTAIDGRVADLEAAAD